MHQLSIAGINIVRHKDTVVKVNPIPQLSKEDQAIKTYLKTSHHLAKHEIPKSRFKCTLELKEAVQESAIHKSDQDFAYKP